MNGSEQSGAGSSQIDALGERSPVDDPSVSMSLVEAGSENVRIERDIEGVGKIEIFVEPKLAEFLKQKPEVLEEAVSFAKKVVKSETDYKSDFEKVVSKYCLEKTFVNSCANQGKYFENHGQLLNAIANGELVKPDAKALEQSGIWVDEAQIGDCYTDFGNPIIAEMLENQLKISHEEAAQRRQELLNVSPELVALMTEIGQRFQTKMVEIKKDWSVDQPDTPLPEIRLKITGLGRTDEYQSLVRAKYPDASASTTNHATGHAFDIGFSSFRYPKGTPDQIGRSMTTTLMTGFEKVLREIEDQMGQEMVFYKENACFHIGIGSDSNQKIQNLSRSDEIEITQKAA